MKVPKPIFKFPFNGNAQANPYLTNPNSNLAEFSGIFPSPFIRRDKVFANFWFFLDLN